MTPKDIKIELLRAGVTQRQIAKWLEVSPPYVNMNVNGVRRDLRVRRAIAEVIGIPADQIWTDGKA